VRRYLALRGAWDESRERAFVDGLDARFKEAVAAAERTPKPPIESLFDDVYAKRPWHLEEQRRQLLAGPRPKDHA
jgi:2-oxoisovalerate dehydrogenase E1 component alpha subunit